MADVDPHDLASWFLKSDEPDVERTAVLPAVLDESAREDTGGDGHRDVTGDADTEPQVAAGRFQHYLHLVDEDSGHTELEDGKPVQFAACDFLVRPPEPGVMPPAWPLCPVCWTERTGHEFQWRYLANGVSARCVRAGCGRAEPEVYDPATRSYLPCEGTGGAEQGSSLEPG